MLTTVRGRFTPDLENGLLDAVAGIKAEFPADPICVVTPSSTLLQRVKRKVAERGDYLNIFFYHYDRLVHELLEQFERRAKRVPPPVQRFIIRMLVEKYPEAFTRLKGVGGRAGIVRALCETIRDLRDATVDPMRAIEALADTEKFLGTNDPAIAEIFKLLQLYGSALDEFALRDDSALYRSAAEHAPQSPLLRSFKKILIYGFYDMTQVQLDLVGAIAGAFETTIFLPSGGDDYAFAEAFAEEYVSPISKSTIKLKSSDEKPEMTIVNTAGLRDEVWRTAKEVLRLVREEGCEFDEIGVIAKNIADYLPTLAAIFGENHIPFTSNSSIPAGRHPAAKAIRKLVDMFRNDFNRHDIIDLLGSPHFAVENFGERADMDIQDFDLLTKKIGVTQGAGLWLKRLDALKDRDCRIKALSVDGDVDSDHVVVARRVDLLRRIVSAFYDELVHFPPNALYSDFGSAFIELMEKALGKEDPIVARCVDEIRELREFDIFDKPVRRDEFFDIVDDIAEAIEDTPYRRNIRGCHVLDVTSARGLSFKALFLLGMNERIFPRFILEDPFLPDAVRSRLSYTLGCKLSRKMDGYAEERMLFKMAIESASRRIDIGYQRVDARGRLMIPSLYLSELPARRVSMARRFTERTDAVNPLDLTLSELTIRNCLRRKWDARLIEHSGIDLPRFARTVDMISAIEGRAPQLTPYDGKSPTAGESGRKREFSPSAFETFALCPFKYFASRCLGLRELEDRGDLLDMPKVDIGSICHAVLKDIYTGLFSGSPSLGVIPPKETRVAVESACERAFSEYEKSETVRFPVLWDVVKEDIVRQIADFVAADLERVGWDQFIPAHFEQELSGDIAAGRDRIRLRGRVDRIDVKRTKDATLFRVIDYKTGSIKGKEHPEKGMVRGTMVQLPLYIVMAAPFLKTRTTEAIPDRADFFFIDGEASEKSSGIDRSQFEEGKEEMGRALGTFVGMISEGDFIIHVNENSHCRWCPYKFICRKSHFPTRLRAEKCASGSEFLRAIGEEEE